MRTASVRFSLPVLLHRRIVPRAHSSSAQAKTNQSRGGLPRFHSPSLPSSKGDVVRIQGDEFWHMTRVLRLSISDGVELFDGSGCLVEGSIQRIDKTGSDIVAVKDPISVAPYGVQWHVYVALGTLKGGRADWLIEKCTELGASSVTPLLTERCHAIKENRVDRLQRVMLAAVKQCQRLHQMAVNSPMNITDLLPIVSQSKPSFIAVAEATPLFNILSNSIVEESGVLIIGPEGVGTLETCGNPNLIPTDSGGHEFDYCKDVGIGWVSRVHDFTEEELKMIEAAGATAVGLGPCRLRVETATIALLSTLMLWSDAQNLSLN